MSVALLQFFMIVFSLIRSLDSDVTTLSSLNPRTKVALGLFILTINICSAQSGPTPARRSAPSSTTTFSWRMTLTTRTARYFYPKFSKL